MDATATAEGSVNVEFVSAADAKGMEAAALLLAHSME